MPVGGDPGFGSGGVVTLNSGTGASALYAVARQSNGSLVGVGAGAITDEGLLLMRSTAAGQLDATFGARGAVQIPVDPIASDYVGTVGLALQSDDKIVVATPSWESGYGSSMGAAVFRFTADGVLDCSFGSGGKVVVDAPVGALAVDSNDEVIVATKTDMIRLTRDGVLDTCFGVAGHAAFPAAPSFSMSTSSIAIAPDGKIVVSLGAGIARYDANGRLDGTFGSGGVVNETFTQLSLAVLGDGSIVVGGYGLRSVGGQPPQYMHTPLVEKLTVGGAIDTTFGSGGSVGLSKDPSGIAVTDTGDIVVDTYFGPSQPLDQPGACIVLDGSGGLKATCQQGLSGLNNLYGAPVALPGGSFAVPGTLWSPTSIVAALAIVDVNGAVTSVVASGVVGASDTHEVFALEPDGSIIAEGASWGYGDAAHTTMFKLNPTGVLDTTFGTAGVLDMRGYPITGFAVQATGDIVISRYPGPSPTSVTIRLNPNGIQDSGFGSNGEVDFGSVGPNGSGAFPFLSVGELIGSGDAIEVFGNANVQMPVNYANVAAVLRLTPDGAFDSSYGTAGVAVTPIAFTSAYAALGSDGSTYLLGQDATSGCSIIHFTTTGAFDTAFGNGGQATVSSWSALGLVSEPDGKIVAVSGLAESGDLEITRFAADGTLDNSFGTGGTVTLQLGGGNDVHSSGFILGPGYVFDINGIVLVGPSIAIDNSGNILFGTAIATSDGLSEQAAIVRLLPDGTPDTTWGPGGIQRLAISEGPSAISGLQFQPDGKLLVGGHAWTAKGNSDFAVVRLSY
jgi:uncharacterized delta-60 repeat protein